MGSGKGRRSGKKNKMVEEKKKVLVKTFTAEEGLEFHSIDLEAEAEAAVGTKLATELLDREGIIAAVVPLPSRVYLFGYKRNRPPYFFVENEGQNERGFVHGEVSYIDIVRSTDSDGDKKVSAEWKAAPPRPVSRPRPHYWRPDCLFVDDGNIYCFTFKSNKADVYDPDLNQWRTQSVKPPEGFANFRIQKPVLYDRSNHRLLVSFHRDFPVPSLCPYDPVGSLYAYYPSAAPGASGRWDLLVPKYEPDSFMLAVDSGVIFSHDPNQCQNTLFNAFDVDSKKKLNIEYSSDFDQRIWNLECRELLNVGDSTLCLLAPAVYESGNTCIYTLRFKIHRKGPLHVVLTPFPAKFFSLQKKCHPLAYYAF